MNNDILSVIVYYYILLQRSHINLKDGLKVGFLSPRNSLLTYIHTILVSNSSLPVSYCETKIESSYVLRQSHILRKRMPSITKNNKKSHFYPHFVIFFGSPLHCITWHCCKPTVPETQTASIITCTKCLKNMCTMPYPRPHNLCYQVPRLAVIII